jgi:hypothetical protein
VKDILIRDNTIRDTAKGTQEAPFRISTTAKNIYTRDNQTSVVTKDSRN